MLTAEQIETLASKKGVKRIAVENFLGTLGDLNYPDARGNLDQDQRDYGWNNATYAAISAGLRLHFGR